MADYEYDYQRFDEIIEKMIRDYIEIDDEPECLRIGKDISAIPAVKIIFDGFGLAEELFYNDRTFAFEDGVVMVENDERQYEPLSEDDEDYQEVLEKLELFEQYSNSDGPCNPQSQSFAVFIHRDAINEGFEFPPHDVTPWYLVHRPKEEVCIYVWWDRDTDTIDVLPLGDRVNNTEMDEEDVMRVLEHIASDYGFDNVE